MDTLFGGHRSLRLFTAAVLMGSAPAHAQTSPLHVIAPAQQAERDAMRLYILKSELAAEVTALNNALNRRVERGRAGDGVGLAEALAAVGTHSQNIIALRRELDLLSGLANPSPTVVALRDAYERARTPSIADTAASCGVSEVAPLRPQWDMFQFRSNPAHAPCSPGDEAHAPTGGVMWLKRGMPSDPGYASGAALERSAANIPTSRERPRTPVLVSRENAVTQLPAVASQNSGKVFEGNPAPPSPARYRAMSAGCCLERQSTQRIEASPVARSIASRASRSPLPRV